MNMRRNLVKIWAALSLLAIIGLPTAATLQQEEPGNKFFAGIFLGLLLSAALLLIGSIIYALLNIIFEFDVE